MPEHKETNLVLCIEELEQLCTQLETEAQVESATLLQQAEEERKQTLEQLQAHLIQTKREQEAKQDAEAEALVRTALEQAQREAEHLCQQAKGRQSLALASLIERMIR